ncbi:MAG: hypothetical protein RIC56_03830 [Pseudomonadales bacterium]
MRKPRDVQRSRVYAWERSFRQPEQGLGEIRAKDPFPPQLLRLFQDAWKWGSERMGRHDHKFADWWGDEVPALTFSPRLKRFSAHAGFVSVGGGWLKPGIAFGTAGFITPRHTLLHELAHVFTMFDGDGRPFGAAGHDPRFCRVALDLYARYLGVDESKALVSAVEQRVRIADTWSLPEVSP